MSLREYRGAAQTFGDLLPYFGIVDDGVMLMRDGALLAAWEYRGPDLDSASHEEMASLATRINGGIKLGKGVIVQFFACRNYGSEVNGSCQLGDEVLNLIELERQRQYGQIGATYETRYFLSLTWMPPTSSQEKARGFFFSGSTLRDSGGAAHRALERFTELCDTFEGRLGAALRMRRLKRSTENDQLLSFVRGIALKDIYPAHPSEISAFIGHRLGFTDFVGGVEPKVGKYHLRMVAVGGGGVGERSGFPRSSYPGILGELDRLPIRYDWSNRLILLDPHECRNLFEHERRKWNSKTRSFVSQLMNDYRGPVDADAVAMSGEAQTAAALAASGDVEFCLYSAVVTVYDEDPARADEHARAVVKRVHALGFEARIEDVNAVESYLGTLPGQGYADVRRVVLHTINAADMAPVNSIYAGEVTNPSSLMPPNSGPVLQCSTTGHTPYRLHFHVSDVGHTLMLGPTGAGKSTALALMVAQWFRYPGAAVFAFDKGYSLEVLGGAANARQYDLLGPESTLAFAPLRTLETVGDVAWAVEWIEALCTLQGAQWTPVQSAATSRAITLLRDAPTGNRSLTEFCATVQDHTIRDALKPYQTDGPLGTLLDSQSDDLEDGRFQVFELEHLMRLGDKVVLPVLLYLFRQIERRLSGDPTLIVLDEAWVFFGHPLFQSKIREWLKTFRKKNAAVILATQNPSDVFNSGIVNVLLESCPTRFLLANPDAKSPDSREFYKRMGLNDREIEIIAAATPKQHYYIIKPDGRRLVSLGLGPVALAFVGASGDVDRRVFRTLIRSHGRLEGTLKWLENRGQTDWAAYARNSWRGQ